ncbi:hypothetical protein [Pseudomonas ovata]|uniref:hypothetical protein n=1 Tax=Pseudomonas ovata TaxID=1839709 RepID=UPI000D68B3B9|nr:hypothetical protein [Pseudomonas ovata]
MQTCFDPLIHVDWKIPGGELLTLFQHYYPEMAVFCGPAFEALLDELSHEMPEVCFQALAPLLAAQGHDLWNLDAGADDYRPVIVPVAQRQAFARHWQNASGELRFSAIRIEAPEPEPAVAPSRSRKHRLDWLQDRHDYPGPTYINDDQYHQGMAAITEQDEDRWLCFVIDYNPWPPVEHDMLEQRTDDVDGADLQLLDVQGSRTLWKRRVVRGQRHGEDRYRYETCKGQTIEPFGPAQVQWPEFEPGARVIESGIFERQRLYEPGHLTRLWRITASTSEVIFEYPDDLTLLPVGERRLLILQHNGLRCWLWHQDPPHALVSLHPLPVQGGKLTASTVHLGGDEMLLFSEGARPNLEDAGYQETVLLAWRFNFLTGVHRRAVLDGFGSEVRQETRMLVTQPSHRITLRTFHGQVQARRGHGAWWVWTYHSQTPGTQTLAWFWNQDTHQVLKLSSRDIPRIRPHVRYVAAQDRYLAFDTDFVARLPPFERMLEAKGCDLLTFEPVQ